MNFFTANLVDKLFSLLSLSHFTEFYYHDGAVMSRDRLFVLQDDQQGQDTPKAHVFISQDTHAGKNIINISFMIEKVDGLAFNNFDPQNIAKADNLWQETCLECFIGLSDGSYLEINATPDGRYAIYHFEDYRTPDVPTPTDKVSLHWRADDNDNTVVYERHFSLDVSGIGGLLPSETLINPCLILKINGKIHHLTTRHATPPDFHNKAYWQKW